MFDILETKIRWESPKRWPCNISRCHMWHFMLCIWCLAFRLQHCVMFEQREITVLRLASVNSIQKPYKIQYQMIKYDITYYCTLFACFIKCQVGNLSLITSTSHNIRVILYGFTACHVVLSVCDSFSDFISLALCLGGAQILSSILKGNFILLFLLTFLWRKLTSSTKQENLFLRSIVKHYLNKTMPEQNIF